MTAQEAEVSRLIDGATIMAASIARNTDGEEMENLLERQLAVINQLALALGVTPSMGFTAALDELVHTMTAVKIKEKGQWRI